MNVQELLQQTDYKEVALEGDLQVSITKPFCCDLLSIAMGKAPAGAAWVTVMANMNTLAVAALTEVALIVLAEGSMLDEVTIQKAKKQHILVVATKKPVFDTAYEIKRLLGE